MGKPIFEQGVLKVVGKPLGRQVFKPRVSTQIGTSLTQLQQIVNTGQMRICIVRSLGGIGDVLMSTPLLRAIKYQWPNCHLTYATDFKYVNGGLKDILLYNPYIDELISHHSVAGREFDFKADITSCCIHAEKQIQRPPNRIDIFAEHVGVSLAETGHLPDYIVSTTEQQWAKEKLSRFPLRTQNTRRIGIQVRSSTLTRSWPLEKVRELAIKLAAHDDIQVCIFDSVHGQGPREEWNISRLVNLSDLSIRPTAALINEMDLFIAPDSGLLHVAGALNKRIVALFAGTDSNARINYYPNAVAIARNDWKCWPCWYSGEACNRQYTCIHSITVDEVYNAVMQLLVTPQVLRSVYIPEQSQTNKEINIIRAVGGLGDLICVSAVIHAYKVQHPDIAINLFVPEQYNDIFIGNPDITQLKSCQTPILSKYCCNLTDVDAKHEVAALKQGTMPLSRNQIYASALGIVDLNNLKPRIFLTDEEKSWARDRLDCIRSHQGQVVSVLLQSAEQYRNWPLNNYRQLFDLANKQYSDMRFVIVDGRRPREMFQKNVVDLSGFSIREFFALIHASDIVLSPDSSAVHIAAAFNKPCIALFGPIGWQTRCSGYLNTTVLASKRSCVPCWRNEVIPCKHKLDRNVSKCMTDITAQQVLSAIQEI